MLVCLLIISCSSSDSSAPAVTAPISIAGEEVKMTITSGAGLLATTGTYTISFSANLDTYDLTGDGVNVGDSAGTYKYAATGDLGVVSVVDSTFGASVISLTFTSATSGTFLMGISSDLASNQAGTFTQL